MENEREAHNSNQQQADSNHISFESNLEKELVTLIATIIVEKTLKNAGEKSHSISQIQP